MATPLQEFVLSALRANGHDGMCDGGGCGCGIDDFAPCEDGPHSECSPARRLVVPESGDLIDPKDGNRVNHDGKPGDSVFVYA